MTTAAIPYEPAVAEDLNIGYGEVDVTSPAGGTHVGRKINISTFIPGEFNVKDYGALGDGVTNDTTAVQNAITAAMAYTAANTMRRAVVYFPFGRYRIIGAISAPAANRVTLRGDSRMTSVLVWDDTATIGLLVDTVASGSGNPVSSALTANGNIGDYDINVASGATFTAGAWAYLEDTTAFSSHGTFVTRIKSIAGDVVTLAEALPCPITTAASARLYSYVSNPLLEDVVIRDLGFACTAGASTANKLTLLFLSRIHNVQVERCHFAGSVGPLLTTRALKNGVIRDCTFIDADTGAGASGIESQTSTGLLIEGCQGSNLRFGIVLSRSARSKVVGCTMSGINDVDGGRCLKTFACYFCVFANCTVSDAGYTAIRVDSSSYCTVTGCTVFAYSVGENGAGGIAIGSDSHASTHCTIAGNTIYGGGAAGATGINISFFAANTDMFHTVVGNTVVGCKRYALYCGGNRITITGNKFGSEDTGAILFVTVDCGYNIIDDNVFVSENGATAAAIYTSTSLGYNVIGFNKHTTTLNLSTLDIIAASTIWKLPTATQTNVQTGANTTETTAWTVTVPAATFTPAMSLAAGFRMTATLNMANNTNTKTIKVKVGTTVTLTFALTGAMGEDTNIALDLEGFVSSTAMSLRCTLLAMSTTGTVAAFFVYGATSTDNWANAVEVKITMTNGTASAGDMSFEAGKFIYEGVVIRPTPVA